MNETIRVVKSNDGTNHLIADEETVVCGKSYDDEDIRHMNINHAAVWCSDCLQNKKPIDTYFE